MTEVLNAVALVCLMILIGAMAFAVFGKLRHFREFERSIEDFALLPTAWNALVAYGLIAAEGLCVFLLAAGGSLLGYNLLRLGLLATIALLLLVSIALGLALLRKRKVRCNCFGVGDSEIAPTDLLRNGGFVAVAAIAFWALPAGVDRLTIVMAAMPFAQIVLAAVLAAILAIVLIRLSDILFILAYRPPGIAKDHG